MKIKVIVFFTISVVLFQCTAKKDSKVDFTLDSFELKDSILNGKTYNNSNLFLANPRWIKYHPDSFLIISELTNSSKFIKIIDLKSNEIQEMIPSGKGPGEMITAWGIGLIGENIWVFDGQLRKICILRRNKDRIFSIETEFSLKEKSAIGACVMNDSVIACLTGIEDKKNRLSFYDNKGNVIKKIGAFPELRNNSEIDSDNNIFMSAMSLQPKSNNIILACVSTDIFEIYNYNKGLINRLHGPLGIDLIARNVDIGFGYKTVLEPRYSTYYNIACSDTSIWISYSGNYFDKHEKRTPENVFPKTILCFTDTGLPTRILEFRKNLLYFDVDWRNRIIYCLELQNETPTIVSYMFN